MRRNLHEKLNVVYGDFMKVPLPPFDVCVANIPYQVCCHSAAAACANSQQISSPVVRRLLGHEPRMKRAVIMFQKEFADRLVALYVYFAAEGGPSGRSFHCRPGDKNYCRLSVNTQMQARARILMDVHRSEFRPPPKVDSAIVELVPFGWPVDIDFEVRRRHCACRDQGGCC